MPNESQFNGKKIALFLGILACLSLAAWSARSLNFFGRRPPPPLTSDIVQMNDILAVADAKNGAEMSVGCAACHAMSVDDPIKKVGPSLWGIVGAPIASRDGYAYSDALLKLRGKVWTTDLLYEWLRDPPGFAPGTKMSFGGLLDPQDRADMIAYLMTLR